MKQYVLIISFIFALLSILLLITACNMNIDTLEKLIIKQYDFIKYEGEAPPLVVKKGWFQNFETGSADLTHDSAEEADAWIYDLSDDPDDLTDDIILDPSSDFCLKQDPKALTENCNTNKRVALITPKNVDDTSDINYAVDASDYKYLISHIYIDTYGTKSGIPNITKYFDDVFFQIYSGPRNSLSEIWSDRMTYFNPTGSQDIDDVIPTGQWVKIVIDMSENRITTAKIDKSMIRKITICQYDDYNLYIDNIYFAVNATDPVPEY